jgi:hypothetical protein
VLLLDRLIFILTDAWLYARNWRLVKAYHRRLDRWPAIARPGRYSELMLWRKLLDHNPQFVIFSDKLETKVYSQARCPELLLARTLWEGTDANAIPAALLSGDVYVKTNHGCGFNIRCSGGQVDRAKLKMVTDEWMRSRYGILHGEWAYGEVKPRLFVEESIGDAEADMLEFQVRAGGGRFILGSVIGHAKSPCQWAVYLDGEGRPLKSAVTTVTGKLLTEVPVGLDILEPYKAACRYALRLSEGVDYARFDFLWDGGKLYGGEITVYPGAGIGEISDPQQSAQMLAGWRLERSWFLSTRQRWPVSVYANALRRRLSRWPAMST